MGDPNPFRPPVQLSNAISILARLPPELLDMVVASCSTGTCDTLVQVCRFLRVVAAAHLLRRRHIREQRVHDPTELLSFVDPAGKDWSVRHHVVDLTIAMPWTPDASWIWTAVPCFNGLKRLSLGLMDASTLSQVPPPPIDSFPELEICKLDFTCGFRSWRDPLPAVFWSIWLSPRLQTLHLSGIAVDLALSSTLIEGLGRLQGSSNQQIGPNLFSRLDPAWVKDEHAFFSGPWPAHLPDLKELQLLNCTIREPSMQQLLWLRRAESIAVIWPGSFLNSPKSIAEVVVQPAAPHHPTRLTVTSNSEFECIYLWLGSSGQSIEVLNMLFDVELGKRELHRLLRNIIDKHNTILPRLRVLSVLWFNQNEIYGDMKSESKSHDILQGHRITDRMIDLLQPGLPLRLERMGKTGVLINQEIDNLRQLEARFSAAGVEFRACSSPRGDPSSTQWEEVGLACQEEY